MLEKLATVRLGVDLTRLSWQGRLRQASHARAQLQSPVVRAALLGGLGHAFLLLFPTLVYAAVMLADLPQRIVTASTTYEFVIIALWLAVGGLALLVTYALIRFRPAFPPGHVRRREDAPELFQLLDEVRREYSSPLLRRSVKLHHICITDGPGVEVIRTPRCGFPFVFHNTLAIGLPATQTLSPLQLKVALARKLGQLASRDNVLAGWVYHVRLMWSCYTRSNDLEPAPCRWLLQAFFGWYVPFYHRISAEAARAFECAGDEYALQVVDHESVSEGIVAMSVNERFLSDKFWPAINSMCGKLPEPKHLPYAHLEQAFRKGVKPAERQAWLGKALRAKAESKTAMPTLQERVQDLGRPIDQLPELAEQSAARHYLGPSLAAIVQGMDQAWLHRNRPVWRKRFKKHQKAKSRLSALRQKLDAAELSDDEVRELIKLTSAHLGGANAAILYQSVLKQKPNDAKVHFAIGSRLLAGNDAAGVAALERAMELEERYAEPACKLISQFRMNSQ